MRVAVQNPLVGKLGEEFDRVFDRLLAPRLYAEPFLPPWPYGTGATEWIPTMDVVETPAEYLVRLEVPGIHRENLDVNLTGKRLIITGIREMVPAVEGEGYLVKERVYGKFGRTVQLPAPVAEKKVNAEYRDGVLEIHIPKETPAPATRILIK
jgi:HSP20 family protein